ncbi:MAG: hypothetical protein ABS918_02290 [Saccharopolyspora rectivirgula]
MESWKTPEIRAAEEALEEALLKADEAIAEADQFSASLPDTSLSQEQIQQIEQLVREGKAPPEIRVLQERIDAGELSWDDIANGRALRDEGVKNAFALVVSDMQRAKDLIDEGHSLDDIIDADPHRAPQGFDDDDDYPPDSMLQR